MLIYDYDPITGEYLGSREAQLDPLERKKGNEVPLVPSYATLEAPPAAGVNETAVYAEGWSLVADYRGQTAYLPDGSSVIISVLGPLPVGWSFTPPVPIDTDIIDTVRFVRDRMLYECDWTQLPDAPLTNAEKTEWVAVRQELRDCPDYVTGGFFYNVFTDAEKIAWRTPTPNMIMDLMGRDVWE